MTDLVKEFVKPELLVLVPVLNALGAGLKHAAFCKDEHIPAALGGAGVLLAALWVFAAQPVGDIQSALLGAFTAIVQGVLCAAAAVYTNQLYRQEKSLAGGGRGPLTHAEGAADAEDIGSGEGTR